MKCVRRWMNGNWIFNYVKAAEFPSTPESKATQTEPSGQEQETSGSHFETVYDVMCRERNMWQYRCRDLLNIILCGNCREEKDEVYENGVCSVSK